jgi:NAD(P)-dependent dehydrogenase (short-subunit alcohol dehydrogenase family)
VAADDAELSSVSGELTGRRVLVTGAAGGIGAAAVEALTAAGAQVVATYHRTEPQTDAEVDWLRCDVTDEDSVAQAFSSVEDRFGRLDVLIHAAGLWTPGIPGQVATADLDATMKTNFTSTVLTNQAAYRLMCQNGGQIINFGSAEGVMGSPVSAGYAAAKAAVTAWTRSIAKAWGSQGITANALAPAVDTPGAQRFRDFLGPAAAPIIDQQLRITIPLGGKLGNPRDDIGPILVFLSSAGARFITGQLIPIDGGLLMH